jgi:hypothetical protein
VAGSAALLLTACGGGDDSGPSADSTALPHDKASDTRSDDGSDQPSATSISQENPKRFIARWAAAEAKMQNTGKVAAYLALSRDCQTCRQLAHTVSQYYAAGGFIRGGAWKIDSVKAVPASSGLLTYAVLGHAAPMTVQESSSGAVQHVPAAPVAYLIGIQAKGSSFTVGSRTRGS